MGYREWITDTRKASITPRLQKGVVGEVGEGIRRDRRIEGTLEKEERREERREERGRGRQEGE